MVNDFYSINCLTVSVFTLLRKYERFIFYLCLIQRIERTYLKVQIIGKLLTDIGRRVNFMLLFVIF